MSMLLEPHLYDLWYIDTIKLTWVFSSVVIMFLVLVHMMKMYCYSLVLSSYREVIVQKFTEKLKHLKNLYGFLVLGSDVHRSQRLRHLERKIWYNILGGGFWKLRELIFLNGFYELVFGGEWIVRFIYKIPHLW